MNFAKLILAAVFSLTVATAMAQGDAVGEKDNRKILRMGLYPPDILMRQQQRLGITQEQRQQIANLVRDFQGSVTELQWSMPAEQQKLRDILNNDVIDTRAALAQVGKVMEMESTFKLRHFELLIGVKNELTPQQIQMLDRAISRRLPQE